MHIITVIDKNVTHTFHVDEKINLLKLLRDNNIELSSPCSGKGKCGKCRVYLKGDAAKPTEREIELLGKSKIDEGYRLACFIEVNSDMTIRTVSKTNGTQIISDFKTHAINLNPSLQKKYLSLEKPSLDDQSSDLERVINPGEYPVKLNDICAGRISDIIRENDFDVTAIYYNDEIIGVEPGNTEDMLYGIATDIGTTTIAAYLYDLKTGDKLDTLSVLNPQRKFGYDVISRIDYTTESIDNKNEMHNEIIRCINSLIKKFCSANKIKSDNIYLLTFVGNTTMMHFLMNFNASNIAVAPFIPVSTVSHVFNTSELKFKCSEIGKAVVFPSVSGYIGADTVGAVLASDLYKEKNTSLLIDIGTNGEIVIGNKERLISCSTAAGPAFEGANIRFGTGGITGAIDSVALGDDIKLTTINNYKPVGICGSGLVDAVSVMLEAGIIDETGRIQDKEELKGNKYAERVIEIDDYNKAFILSKKESNGINENIYITQKDIRELQNAKAAIYAGIMTLIHSIGIEPSEIDNVYLAGGFGNYINVDSAVNISLIPKELINKVKPIGNAAGLGSVLGLLSKKKIRKSIQIKNIMQYLELSANPKFNEYYIDSMIF